MVSPVLSPVSSPLSFPVSSPVLGAGAAATSISSDGSNSADASGVHGCSVPMPLTEAMLKYTLAASTAGLSSLSAAASASPPTSASAADCAGAASVSSGIVIGASDDGGRSTGTVDALASAKVAASAGSFAAP